MAGWAQAAQAATELLGNWWTNDQANDRAQDTREFEERMSSTAHQREVGDLIRAGLNPILSANKGASTPVGATAPVINPASKVVSSALETGRVQAETDRIRAEERAIQQGINIKKPVEEAAGKASSGINVVGDALGGAANAIGQALPTPSEATEAVGKALNEAVQSVTVHSAAAGKKAAELAADFAAQFKRAIQAPGKFVEQTVNSASDAVRKFVTPDSSRREWGKKSDVPDVKPRSNKPINDGTVNPHSSNRRYFK